MTFDEMLAWDHQLGLNPDGGSVYQSAEIAETKRLGGWEPLYRMFNGVAVTILQKHVKYLGAFWYLPKGPGVATTSQLRDLLPELRKEAALHRVFAVKIEPESEKTVETYQQIISLGFTASRAIQPNSSTVLIDLRPGEHHILAGFSQNARGAIDYAIRDGITAQPVIFSPTNARIMYDLLAQAAISHPQGSLQSFDYYYKFWETFYDTDRGSFFFAYANGQVASAAFAMYLGRKSTQEGGVNARDKQAYISSHLLQWEIIKWMKDRGCLQHDLYGTPPSDQAGDSSHPYYESGLFKTGFNGQITDYIGAFDLPIHRFKYWLWVKFGERLALRHYYKKLKQSWY